MARIVSLESKLDKIIAADGAALSALRKYTDEVNGKVERIESLILLGPDIRSLDGR